MTVRFCRSRNAGRRCTRPLDHPGLHRHRAIMWTDAAADPSLCASSHAPGTPSAALEDGWPDGRALCPLCHRFIPLEADRVLAEHDTSDPAEPDAEASHRREWLNTHGW